MTTSRRWVVPVVVAVVAAIVGSATVILFVDTDTAGASVVLESATDPGTDPFTRSVAVGELADFPTTIAPITRTVTAELTTDTTTGGLTATGNAPGLYGGTGNESVCDPHQLADYLTRTPTKAAAWAATLGIRPTAIPTYIAGLTPVVLTTDTHVTNHGYANGTATPRQAVLQAGTAVLVDNHGIPRVKCGCGNPLTEPAAQPITTTTGTPWTGYQPDTVTTITPTPHPQPTLTLTDITTGDTYTQPTGDVLLAATQTGSLYAFSDDGTTSIKIGSIAPVNGAVTDIAADADGALYATTSTRLYRVDPQTAAATAVGNGYRGIAGMNALTFLDDGRLIGATQNGTIAVIDPDAGTATEIGRYGTGIESSGDLAIGPAGELFATVTTRRSPTGDALVRIDPDTGSTQAVGDGIGYRQVYGLFVSEGRLMGLISSVARCSGSGALVELSTSDGTGEFRRCLDFEPGGATRLARGRPAAEPTSDAGGDDALLDRTYATGGGCFLPADSVTLTDGKWTGPATVVGTSPSVDATITHLDADGNGEDNAVVELSSFTGGSGNLAASSCLVVFTTAGGKTIELGRIGPSDEATAGSLELPPDQTPGTIAVIEARHSPSDALCCPSTMARVTYRFENSGFVATGTVLVPND